MKDNEFDFSQFSQESSGDTVDFFQGVDIFGLLGGTDQEDDEPEPEEEAEEEHIVKFRYSEAKKRKLLDAFQVTYVNDYGKADPYHLDSRNDLASTVRNEIHAIYGNRTIAQYIIAMRKVFQVYREMYQKSVQRMVMSFEDYLDMIISGEIPAPFNHPRVRTNIPDDIIMRYIYDERLDPEDIRKYASGRSNNTEEDMNGTVMIDLTGIEEAWETPVEYQVLDPRLQKKMIQSWLEGKPCLGGLDKNDKNLVRILAQVYDRVGVEDPDYFKFDRSLKYHPDIISWQNVLYSSPDHIQLRHFTDEDLEEKRKGQLIRLILNADQYDESPEVTIPHLIERMERKASANGRPVSAKGMLSIYRLYSQGIIAVKKGKYGQETYEYRDKTKSKKGSIDEQIRDIERRAEFFTDITRSLNERFLSYPFSKLIDEVKHEQKMIERYGLSYYTEGD